MAAAGRRPDPAADLGAQLRDALAGQRRERGSDVPDAPAEQTPEIRAAIEAGIAWLKAHAIYDKAFTKVNEEEGRKLVDRPGAGPIWSRNYDIQTGKPIFGDRDKSIHDDVNFISKGRRNGYSWYSNAPQKALNAYVEYSRKAGTQQ